MECETPAKILSCPAGRLFETYLYFLGLSIDVIDLDIVASGIFGSKRAALAHIHNLSPKLDGL